MKRNFYLICAATVLALAMLAAAFLVGGLAGKLRIQPLFEPINATETMIRTVLSKFRGQRSNQTFLESSLLELSLTSLEVMPKNPGDNVGFTPLGNGYLIAKRNGELSYAELNWPDSFSVKKLPYRVPVKKEIFLQHPVTERHPRIPLHFGVKDIYTLKADDGFYIYASHHFWKEQEACAVFRLSGIRIAENAFADVPEHEWQTLFESQPCLKLDAGVNRLGVDDTLLQAGGRIAQYDADQLLVTIGDHYMEGLHNPDLVQDPAASYGKSWLVNRHTGEATLFTMGHRNPQGLTRDQFGNWWSSEHGPRGGDELNVLRAGANYGWPRVSYGTLYAGYDYPPGADWHEHGDYTDPAYIWARSVGASNLIRLNGSRFTRWGDDLIMASLGGRSLIRLEARGTDIIGTERIAIGDRLRDLAQAADGTLLLMTDSGVFIRVEPAAEAEAGEMDISQQARTLWMACGACHSNQRGAGHHIGPNLAQVFNRPIAGAEDFRYSPALRSVDGRWSEENLDRFLADPKSFAPGNSMTFAGIEDPQQRRLLIQYLKEQ